MTRLLSRQRLIRGRPPLILGGFILAALSCTLLTWAFLSEWWILSAFFWYSIPGNSFLWLPHEPAVISAGAIYWPALVAVVAGLGTLIASIIDHAVFTRAFRSTSLASIKGTRVMKLTADLFNRWPWWTIVLFAFTPLPFYPVRVVAPMAGYSMPNYVSAVVVGRVPRYYLLALGGSWARQLTADFAPW